MGWRAVLHLARYATTCPRYVPPPTCPPRSPLAAHDRSDGAQRVALAQVAVGDASRLRHLVPAEQLEQSAQQQYAQLLQEAKAQGRLVPTSDAQVQRLQRHCPAP